MDFQFLLSPPITEALPCWLLHKYD